MKIVNTLLLILLLIPSYGFSQENKLKVFLNCRCDTSYIKQNTPYLEYVRDQNLSDVEVFAYDIRNAAGARSFDLNFEGNKQYAHLSNKTSFEGNPNYTNDQSRKELLKKYQLGLFPFLVEGGYDLSLEVDSNQKEAEEVVDKWKNWVFEVSGGLYADKEASRKVNSFNLGFEVDKVTEDWRISMDFRHNNSKSSFYNDDQTYNSSRTGTRVFGRVVKSISDHLSAGIFYGGQKDTYQNLDLNYYVQPAIEYSLFPYAEVLNKEITLSYRLGSIHNTYIETTIFGYDEQKLTNHSLNLNVRFRQKWGDISSYMSATQYLNDGTKKRLSLRSNFNIRVIEGLSVRFSSNIQLIRDQFTLPAGDNSIEDLLLQQKQIATDFKTSFSVGLSYTFGSIYNSIINTRL
jgi:hypothetical protein